MLSELKGKAVKREQERGNGERGRGVHRRQKVEITELHLKLECGFLRGAA